MVETIPNTAKVHLIEYQPPFSAICSVGNAPFSGEILIVFQPEAKLIEYESFEDWLFTMAVSHLTIEDLAREVFDKVTEALGPVPLKVTVMARTTVHAPVAATIERRGK